MSKAKIREKTERNMFEIPTLDMKQVAAIEQMCRDLLDQAIRDGLVSSPEYDWSESDRRDARPQHRTSAELVGMVEMMAKFLRKGI